MTPINFHKKEKPLTSLVSMGGGAAGMANAGGAAAKVYNDEIFSHWTYRGDNTAGQAEQNGINLTDKGGLVWIKDRDAANNHLFFDTVRGATKLLRGGQVNDGQEDVSAGFFDFASNGFTHGNWDGIGQVKDYASWTFAKEKGFFDIVQYTGTGSAQQVPHGLDCIPGMILIKQINTGGRDWICWHSAMDPSAVGGYPGLSQAQSKYLGWNKDEEIKSDSNNYWNGTPPTATHFSVNSDDNVNLLNGTYIAYVFAGGKSTSTDDGYYCLRGDGTNNDYIQIPAHTDLDLGTDAFTSEFWIRSNGRNENSYGITHGDSSTGTGLEFYFASGRVSLYHNNGDHQQYEYRCDDFDWHHVAMVRYGPTGTGNFKLFVDGNQILQMNMGNAISGAITFGEYYNGSVHGGSSFITNYRLTKGQALYTTSFKPPTEPLTTTSQGATDANVKVLCANKSTVTGYTRSPSAITQVGTNLTMKTGLGACFLDKNQVKFGEEQDNFMVTCGSYIGNDSDRHFINLGFEPQFVIIKGLSNNRNWSMYDPKMGMPDVNQDTNYLYPNLNNVTYSAQRVCVRPTGMMLTGGNSVLTNASNEKYIYFAVRALDGRTAKEPENATDYWNVSLGDQSPQNYASNFPVDMMIAKENVMSDGTSNWQMGHRPIGSMRLGTNLGGSADNWQSLIQWDKENGILNHDHNNSALAYMWKQGRGFDLCTWEGTEVQRSIGHNLGVEPDMIWVKAVDDSQDWAVYSKYLNGGTNPHDYGILLNSTSGESQFTWWNNIAITSEGFSIDGNWRVNRLNKHYIAMLFAAQDGLSKFGTFAGNHTSTTLNIGFTPRFLMIRAYDSTVGWAVLDTVQDATWGDGSGDSYLRFNSNAARGTQSGLVSGVTSTTVTLAGGLNADINSSGRNYFWYAIK